MAKTIQVQLQEATQANAELSAKVAELTESQTNSLAASLMKIEGLNADIAALTADVTAKAATITELQAEVAALESAEKDLATRAAAEAARIVASKGHSAPLNLSADDKSAKSAREKYNAMSDGPAKAQFLKENWASMITVNIT